MNIVLVTERYDELNNGTTMSTYRFAQMLRQRGHEVHVLASGRLVEEEYRLPEQYYPVATRLAKMQSYAFAHADEAVFRRAFSRADVVHFLLPMRFERQALRTARKMGVPVSAAFHMQPENITYNIHMPWEWLSRGIYRYFNHTFYQYFSHIHCPTEFIAGQLRQNGYRANLHVISNGVDEAFVPGQKKANDGRFHILMTGRLTYEKRQNVLIDAVAKSKYTDRIQLHLAGKGPCAQELQKQGAKLKHPPEIGFYQKEDLIRLIHSCDLYVHASVIEIEAIACMEAFACGLVPVICDSPKSATVQFALTPENLFTPDDSGDLAKKIDYWVDHPQERAALSEKYAEFANRFRVAHSVELAENMFRQVTEEYAQEEREVGR